MNPKPNGMALPVVLLLLVILTLLVSAAFTLTHEGLRRGEWELRWFLSQRVNPSESRWSDMDWTHLGGGFHLVRSPPESGSPFPAPHRILWCLIPSIEAIRGSFSHTSTSGPVLGPLGLRDLAGIVAGASSAATLDLPSLQLASDGAGDFLIEVHAADDVKLAIGVGQIQIPIGKSWSGLLILEGAIVGGAPGQVSGGVWHWGEALPGDLSIEELPEIRERALHALPTCPRPLFHIADLGRR
jgi:hypothetical protein